MDDKREEITIKLAPGIISRLQAVASKHCMSIDNVISITLGKGMGFK